VSKDIHTYIHSTYAHKYKVHIYIDKYIYIHTEHRNIQTYIDTYLYTYIHIYIFIHTHILTYINTYIHTYKQT
jgi:hypothetical protein